MSKEKYDGWVIMNKAGNFISGSLYYTRTGCIDWWNRTHQYCKWKTAKRLHNHKIVKVKLVEVE